MKYILNNLIVFSMVCLFIVFNFRAINLKSIQSKPRAISFKPATDSLFYGHQNFISDGFDFPVGYPDATAYYNAQKFKENGHLGEDWNAVTGGDSDLGHPIFAISHGFVSQSYDAGPGWGNVIRIIHKTKKGKMVESLYAHCLDRLKQKGDWVKRGDSKATIGNADGAYLAHLHFELREDCTLGLGPGYSSNSDGYISPTDFINANRPTN